MFLFLCGASNGKLSTVIVSFVKRKAAFVPLPHLTFHGAPIAHKMKSKLDEGGTHKICMLLLSTCLPFYALCSDQLNS